MLIGKMLSRKPLPFFKLRSLGFILILLIDRFLNRINCFISGELEIEKDSHSIFVNVVQLYILKRRFSKRATINSLIFLVSRERNLAGEFEFNSGGSML